MQDRVAPAVAGAFAAALSELNSPTGLPLDPWTDAFGVLSDADLIAAAIDAARRCVNAQAFAGTEPARASSKHMNIHRGVLHRLAGTLLSCPQKPDGSPASSVTVVPGGTHSPDIVIPAACALDAHWRDAVRQIARTPAFLGLAMLVRCAALAAVDERTRQAAMKRARRKFRVTALRLLVSGANTATEAADALDSLMHNRQRGSTKPGAAMVPTAAASTAATKQSATPRHSALAAAGARAVGGALHPQHTSSTAASATEASGAVRMPSADELHSVCAAVLRAEAAGGGVTPVRSEELTRDVAAAYRELMALCGGSSLAALTWALPLFSPVRLGDALCLRSGVDPTLPALHAEAGADEAAEASKAHRRVCRRLRIVSSRSKATSAAQWESDIRSARTLLSRCREACNRAAQTSPGTQQATAEDVSAAEAALQQATHVVLGLGTRRILARPNANSLALPVRADLSTGGSTAQHTARESLPAAVAAGSTAEEEDEDQLEPGATTSSLPASAAGAGDHGRGKLPHVSASSAGERERLLAARGDGASAQRLAMWTDSAAFSDSASLSDEEVSPSLPRRHLRLPAASKQQQVRGAASGLHAAGGGRGKDAAATVAASFVTADDDDNHDGHDGHDDDGAASSSTHASSMAVRSPSALQRHRMGLHGPHVMSAIEARSEGEGSTAESPTAAAAAASREEEEAAEARELLQASVAAAGVSPPDDTTSPVRAFEFPTLQSGASPSSAAAAGLNGLLGGGGTGWDDAFAGGRGAGDEETQGASLPEAIAKATGGRGPERDGLRWPWPRRDRVTLLQVLRFWTPVMRRETGLAALSCCLRCITCLPGSLRPTPARTDPASSSSSSSSSVGGVSSTLTAVPPACDALGARDASPAHWVRTATTWSPPPALRDLHHHRQSHVTTHQRRQQQQLQAKSAGEDLDEVLLLAGATAAATALQVQDIALLQQAHAAVEPSRKHSAAAASTRGHAASSSSSSGAALRLPQTPLPLSYGSALVANGRFGAWPGRGHVSLAVTGAPVVASRGATAAPPGRSLGRLQVTPDDLRVLVEALLQRHPDLRPVSSDVERRSRYVTFVVVSLCAALRSFASRGISGREITRSNIADALIMCARGSMHGIAPFGPAPAMAADSFFRLAASLPPHPANTAAATPAGLATSPARGWVTVRQLLQASGYPPRRSGRGCDGVVFLPPAEQQDDADQWVIAQQPPSAPLASGWPESPPPRLCVARELVFAFAKGQSVRQPVSRGAGEQLLCFEDVCWLLQAQEDGCSDTSVDFWLRLLSSSGEGLVTEADVAAAARAVVFHARDAEAAEMYDASSSGADAAAAAARARKEGLLGTAAPVSGTPALGARRLGGDDDAADSSSSSSSGGGAGGRGGGRKGKKKRRRRRSSLLRLRSPGMTMQQLVDEEGASARAACHQLTDIIRPRRFFSPLAGAAPNVAFDATDVKQSLCGAAMFELIFKVQ